MLEWMDIILILLICRIKVLGSQQDARIFFLILLLTKRSHPGRNVISTTIKDISMSKRTEIVGVFVRLQLIWECKRSLKIRELPLKWSGRCATFFIKKYKQENMQTEVNKNREINSYNVRTIH